MDSWGSWDETMWELGSSFVGALACLECAVRAMTGWRADGGFHGKKPEQGVRIRTESSGGSCLDVARRKRERGTV